MSRKVLAAGRDAVSLQALDDRRSEPRHRLRILGQRAIADDRILRIGVNVEDRRVVQRDADRTQLGGEGLSEPRRQRHVAAAPERGHRRPHGERRLEARDASAFLIDADPERELRAERLHVVRQLGHLFGRLDVAREEDDAAQRELAGQRSDLWSDRPAGQAANQQLTDVASNRTGTRTL